MTDALRIRSGAAVAGTVGVPGDKSLSHRALILGGLAEGTSRMRGFLAAGDTLATLACMQALGAVITRQDGDLTIEGRGLDGLLAPSGPLDCVNAGTAMRLLAGVMAGQRFPGVLDGSEQLRRRPMGRITGPLRAMGADVSDVDGHAPLAFSPSALRGMHHVLPVASAQVKSGILLAGLYADGPTTVEEPGPARDHTERMLRRMDADVRVEGFRVTLHPGQPLHALDFTIPGDISSAAFLLVAGRLAGNDLVVTGVGVNPTRTGVLDVLAAMGADVQVFNRREEAGEPVADLAVTPGDLQGTAIDGALIVRAIDEFPALMVAATQAQGMTTVREAAELRVKETDRIAVMAGELAKMGARVEERPDGFRIAGPQRLQGAVVDGHDDHRIAMALAIAGLVADGETVVRDAACAADSFPGFAETLTCLGADAQIVPGPAAGE